MEKREITTIVLSTAALCLAASLFAGPAPTPAATPATTPPSPARDSAMGKGTVGTTPGMATTTSSPAAVPGEFSDAEIIELVLAIDGHEVAAANVAQKKKIAKGVMDYAKMLRKAHSKDSLKVAKLAKKLKITPAASPTSDEMRAKGAAEVGTLAGKDAAEFEAAYIDAMVKGHTEALALFDDRLLKNADNEELKQQLAETRHHVAEHLEQGKRLQGARASSEP